MNALAKLADRYNWLLAAIIGGTLVSGCGKITQQEKAAIPLAKSSYYLSKGQYQNAIEECNTALTVDPNLPLAFYERGHAYVELGQYDKSMDDLNKAISLDPKCAACYDSRGYAYLKQGAHQKAVGEFNQAINFDANFADAYYHRSEAYKALGNDDLAAKDQEKATALGYAPKPN